MNIISIFLRIDDEVKVQGSGFRVLSSEFKIQGLDQNISFKHSL